MQVSISKAHKMTGVARSTIYKDIDEGKLSCTTDARGKKTIIVSELQRVYGDVQINDIEQSKSKQKVSQNVAGDGKRSQTTFSSDTNQVAVLQERIEALTSKVHSKDEYIDDLKEERRQSKNMFEERIGEAQDNLKSAQAQAEKVTLLLENKSKGQGGNSEWQKSFKALEERISNQEAARLKELEKATERENKRDAEREEKAQKLKELEEALKLEKAKSFLHKILGK